MSHLQNYLNHSLKLLYEDDDQHGTEGRHTLRSQKIHATGEFVKTVASSPATVAGRLKVGFGLLF